MSSVFEQAAAEIEGSLRALFERSPHYEGAWKIMKEPETVHQWRATYELDDGSQGVETCWRVRQSGSLGPYKGGTRFDASVNLDILRFLALEQTLKNALTGFALGSGKGGSTFSARDHSATERRRFARAYMQGFVKTLPGGAASARYDVPAGDLGVDETMLNWMYGEWRALGGYHAAVITGRGLSTGGIVGRMEATGFGLVYCANLLLGRGGALPEANAESDDLSGVRVLVSGTGNVATWAAYKCIALNATLLTVSDRSGTYFCREGFTVETLSATLEYKHKNVDELPVQVEFIADVKPWGALCASENADLALPCSTQNEIDEDSARALVARGVKAVAEGANLPSTKGAVEVYEENNFLYASAKLANLAGVGVSFLEMQQSATMSSWSRARVDDEIRRMITEAYDHAEAASAEYGVSLSAGADIVGFKRVADSMFDMGTVIRRY